MVSIIMPAHNAEKTIGYAIRSLLKQTYKDFELIVIDDGSTDNTANVVAGIRDKRITLLRQEHKGVAPASNYGIANANYDIIMRFDADDIAFPDLVEKELQLLKKNGTNAIISCRYAFFSHKKIIFIVQSKSDPSLRKKYLALHCDFPGSSVMLYKHHITRAGLYQDNLLDDYELWLRMKNNSEFLLVPEILILQHWSNTSLSRNSIEKRKTRQYEIQEQYYKNLAVEFGITDTKEQIQFRAWREFLYGSTEKARKHWRELSLNFILKPKFVIAYCLSFFGDTVIQKILYLQIKYRLQYVLFYFSLEARRCRSLLVEFFGENK